MSEPNSTQHIIIIKIFACKIAINPIVINPIAETPDAKPSRPSIRLMAFVIATIQITVIGILKIQNESSAP